MDTKFELPSNPNENGAANMLTATVFIITLSTIAVLARLYVRVFVIRNTGWDVGLRPNTSTPLDVVFLFSFSFFFFTFMFPFLAFVFYKIS